MLNWLAGFVDRHPGWSLLWAMFLLVPLSLLVGKIRRMADGFAYWLWTIFRKDKH